MSKNDDFIRIIAADPDADGPRLVYADWLDEEGNDPARAEFIRLQCALAYKYNPVLRSRELALWQEHGAKWEKPLKDMGIPHVGLRRGLPELVIMPISDFCLDAEEIFKHAPTLNSLDSRDFLNADIAALAVSPYLARIKHLNLTNDVTAFQAQELAASPYIKNLISCSVNRLHDDGAEALARSPHLKNLTELHLYCDRSTRTISDRGARAIANSPHLKNLTHLMVAGRDITDEGARVLLYNLPKLRTLDLGDNPNIGRVMKGEIERITEARKSERHQRAKS